MLNSKDAFLQAGARKPVKVSVDGFGEVYLRKLGYGRVVNEDQVPEGKRAASEIVDSVCDENGNPLFTKDDIDTINEMPLDVVNNLMAEILRVNGLSATNEEIAKN